MVAGLAAGVAESVTFVTPGENLKTKLVQDAAGIRQFTSNSQALRYIVATDGIRGYSAVLSLPRSSSPQMHW